MIDADPTPETAGVKTPTHCRTDQRLPTDGNWSEQINVMHHYLPNLWQIGSLSQVSWAVDVKMLLSSKYFQSLGRRTLAASGGVQNAPSPYVFRQTKHTANVGLKPLYIRDPYLILDILREGDTLLVLGQATEGKE